MHMMIVKAIADGSGPDITGRIVPMPAGSYHLCREDDRSWFEQRSDVFSFVTQRDDSLAPTALKLDASGTGLVGPDGDIELTAFPYWPIQVSCAAGATTVANGSLLGGVGDVLGKVDYVVNTTGATATLTVQDGTTGTTYTLHPTGGISTAGFGSIDLGYTALVGPWRVTCGAGLAAVANLL